MPKGTDQSFARKLYDNLGQHPGFSAPPRERVSLYFRCSVFDQ